MTTHKTRACCPLCDSQNIAVKHDLSTTYKYLKKSHTLEGQEHTVCADCGCCFFAEGQIERNNQLFYVFESQICGENIPPRKIVELRQKYGLTQEAAKRVFNATGNSFSKWERGESAPASVVSNVLTIALEDPNYMQIMADRAGVTIEREDKVADQTAPRKRKTITASWGEMAVHIFAIERMKERGMSLGEVEYAMMQPVFGEMTSAKRIHIKRPSKSSRQWEASLQNHQIISNIHSVPKRQKIQ